MIESNTVKTVRSHNGGGDKHPFAENITGMQVPEFNDIDARVEFNRFGTAHLIFVQGKARPGVLIMITKVHALIISAVDNQVDTRGRHMLDTSALDP